MKIVLYLFACLLLTEARPSWDILEGDRDSVTSNIHECHGLQCPAGTVGCSKSSETSADSKTIMETIKCEDMHGKVLNSETKTHANPHEGVHISSFSFTGEYSLNGGQYINSGPDFKYSTNYNDYNKDRDSHNFDMVETFDD